MKMKALIGLVVLSLASQAAFALDLEVDTAHSAIGFEVKHLVVSTVRGGLYGFFRND